MYFIFVQRKMQKISKEMKRYKLLQEEVGFEKVVRRNYLLLEFDFYLVEETSQASLLAIFGQTGEGSILHLNETTLLS